MRHQKKGKKLGRTASHRNATLRNIASALIEHHQIRTTLSKAKAAQSYIEKLISYGKNDTVHSRRLAFKMLQNRTLVKMLFDDIATTFGDRKGGYTRVVKLGQRRGDGAPLAILQLVGFEQLVVDEETPKKKKGKGKATKKEAAKETKAAAKKETAKKKADEVAAEEEVTPEETTEQVEETVEKEAKKKPKKTKAKAKKTEAASEKVEEPEASETAEAPEATETEEDKAAEEEKAEPKEEKKKKTSPKEAAEDEGDSETGEEKK